MNEGRNHGDLCSCYEPHEDKVVALRERLVEVAGLSELFAALGVEARTKILYLLSLEEMCVCDLADALELTLPAISHHLRLLKLLRLVKYRREGKMVYYSLADDHVLELIKVAQAHYEEER
ncbi:MAG TPA: transcriptional regulator [Firmicutes bacterium]|nr:transcriptional regulator [Bacillota bacterium]